MKVKCHFSWQVQYLLKVQCHFSWQVQYFVKVKCHFSWQVHVLGEGSVSLFVAGAVLGKGPVSLFVAGAVLGEFWKDRWSAKCCIFQYKMLVLSAKSNLCCAAGCGLTGTVSDPARIMVGTVSDRPRIGNDVSAVLS